MTIVLMIKALERIGDHAVVEGNEAVRHAAFAETMKMLSNRIGIFVSLPIRELDALTLKRELDRIAMSRVT